MNLRLESELYHLERSYWALSPTLCRDLRLPSPAQLALPVVQDWLARHLAQTSEGLSGSWRRAFWKRVLDDIETGTNDLAHVDDVELDERLANAAARCVSSSLELRLLRRFIWGPYEAPLSIESLEEGSMKGTTGLKTWQAGIRLANYLLAHPELVQGKHVIELGAGTGLLSMVAARLGAAQVYATDGHQDVLKLLRTNVARNDLNGIVIPQQLDWNLAARDTSRFDLVLGADIVFDLSLIAPLVRCLGRVLRRKSTAYALLASTVRAEATLSAFVEALGEHGLSYHEFSLDSGLAESEILGGHDEERLTGARVIGLSIQVPDAGTTCA